MSGHITELERRLQRRDYDLYREALALSEKLRDRFIDAYSDSDNPRARRLFNALTIAQKRANRRREQYIVASGLRVSAAPVSAEQSPKAAIPA